MSLNIGELVGYIGLDTGGLDEGLESAGDKLKDFGGKGAVLAAGAGVAIGGAIAAGVLGSMDIEAANDKLAAQLGLNASESKRLGDVAGKLYAGAYGDSMEEVNSALAEVRTGIAGMEKASSADLQAVTANALDFAAAMDVDVSEAARSAGILVKTGLAKDAREAFDLLTVAAQEAGPAMVEPIMEAANEYAVNFNSMGLNGRAAMAILVDASKGGEIALDKAGDAVKEFGIRATDLGDTGAQDALKALGLSGKEMAGDLLAGGDTASKAFNTIVSGLEGIKDPTKQAGLAVALFGTPIEDLSKDQIPTFLAAMGQAGGELEHVKGAADRMGKTLADNASTNLESFKRQAQATFIEVFGGKVLPVVNDGAAALSRDLGPALKAVGGALKDTAGFARDHETASKILLGTIVALVAITRIHAAVMAVQAAGGMLAYLRSTTLVTAATKVFTAVQWLMNAALSANPIALVVIAIAALAAGLVIAYKKSETFRNIVNGAFSAVLGAVDKLMGGIQLLFGALSHVPGFGWAKTAAHAIGEARDKVNEFRDGLNKIPAQKKVTISLAVNGINSLEGAAAKLNRLDKAQGDGPGAVLGSGKGSAGAMAHAAIASFGGRITSTYRTPASNAAAGGSPGSYHLDHSNPANDIVTPNMNATFDWLAKNYGSGIREMIFGHRMLKNGHLQRYAPNDHFDHLHLADQGGVFRGPGYVRMGAGEETFASGLQPARKVADLPAGGGGITVHQELHVVGTDDVVRDAIRQQGRELAFALATG